MAADGYLAGSTPGAPPSGGLPLALYADFERKRGGLLHALQGLLLPAQLLVLSRASLGHWWSPVVLMPLHLAYFAVRGPIWRRLYRQHGHLESEEEIRGARGACVWIWAYPALTIFLTTLNMHNLPVPSHVPWLAAALWIMVMWVPVMLWGKIPVDWVQFFNTWILLDQMLRLRSNPSGPTPSILLIAAIWVAFGVTQHLGFVRGMARGGGAHDA